MNPLKTLAELLPKRKAPMPCYAVIVAAGRGERMQSEQSKQFMELDGKPVLAYTLEAFEECGAIDGIIVVTREAEVFLVAELAKEFEITKLKTIVKGGATRQESVRCGLEAVEEGFEGLIAVHDGARPFVSPDEIFDVVEAARECGAAASGVPIVDTVKRCDGEGFIEATVDRTNLWAIHTPQVFEFGLLQSAHEAALKAGVSVTDDCMAVERMGIRVKLVAGSPDNIKITTPPDIDRAMGILMAREEVL